MAVDMFLVFETDGLKGESSDEVYKDTIDVLAWSWGLMQPGNNSVYYRYSSPDKTTENSNNTPAEKTQFLDISITKWVDQSSPELMNHCASRTLIPSAKLIVRKKAKEDQKAIEYITIDMKKVMVTSVSTGGSGGENRLTENISLKFEKLKYNYQKPNEAGVLETPKVFSWNTVDDLPEL